MLFFLSPSVLQTPESSAVTICHLCGGDRYTYTPGTHICEMETRREVRQWGRLVDGTQEDKLISSGTDRCSTAVCTVTAELAATENLLILCLILCPSWLIWSVITKELSSFLWREAWKYDVFIFYSTFSCTKFLKVLLTLTLLYLTSDLFMR